MRRILLIALMFPVAAGATSPQPPRPVAKPEVAAIYPATGAARGLVLFLSGDGGWNAGVVDMARIVARQGFTVAGLSAPAYLKAAEADPAPCIDLAADLIRLARQLERQQRLPERPPIFAGYSSGATMAYAALAQSPPHSVRGAVSLGFGPDQAGIKPWCAGTGLAARRITRPEHGWLFSPARSLAVPWLVLQGAQDQVVNPESTRAFVASVPTGQLVWLPKVGHGFSVPRNWVPQFSAAFNGLLKPAPPAAQRPVP